MLLCELYQEEKGSSFTHDGQQYDLNKLLSIVDRFRPRTFKVDDLKWVLMFGRPDPERVADANPDVPIIVTYWNRKLVAIDGLHRLQKAVDTGRTHIEGKFVYKDVLDKCKKD